MTKSSVPFLQTKAGPILAFALMILGVLAVYFPHESESGRSGLIGFDHLQLHMRRIAFAQEALMGRDHALPGWYSRELMGTPFWSNVQNFPFLPTRLLVLLVADPFNALTVGAILAAVLSATFTFLFCRKIDFSPTASAAAGWTFACAGFFASRVLAGHLPLLEAYPSLPLLLLLAENALQAREEPGRFARNLLWLGLASACVPLAGHPQFPIYSMVTAGLYVLFRDRRRAGFLTITAMGIGALIASFALWPMLLLTARSTRVLALDPAANDIALPYGRLLAFFFPWKDGWSQGVAREPFQAFTGYPSAAYFWDTVCYVGWAPWIASIVLLIHRLRTRKPLESRLRFVLLIGGLALVFSLPFWQAVMAHIPGTFLRSPVRQLYLTTFALALGLGAAIDCLMRMRRLRPLALSGIAFALVTHGFDLGIHDRAFIVSAAVPEALDPAAGPAIARFVGTGRIAMDCTLISEWNRRFDDVGFFDSIMLARSYGGILSLNGMPPRLNIQRMDGSRLNPRTLAALGVRLVVTDRERTDLADLVPGSRIHIFAVPDAVERTAFFPEGSLEILPPAQIHERLRDRAFDPSGTLLLRNDEASPPPERPVPPAEPAAVSYRRPAPDDIEVSVKCSVPGCVRVLETWDRGWHAELNGASVPVLAGDDMFLTVRVTPGTHRIRLRFQTPGAATGAAISLMAILTLAGLAWHAARGVPA